MAELRHATAAAAARASCSPTKRDAESATSASSPFLPSPTCGNDGGKDGAPRFSPPLHQRCPLPAPVGALLALEDPRSPSAPASYRILLAVLACLALAALVSALSVWSRLVHDAHRTDRSETYAYQRVSMLMPEDEKSPRLYFFFVPIHSHMGSI